jgi:predicted ATPase
VGRAAEVEALQDALSRLQAGIGGIVTVVGEAGIGKSRLVTELRKSHNRKSPADRQSDLRWIEGRCLSYTTGVSYQLWLDMLRGWLDVAPDTPPIAVRETLRERVQALCPDRLDDVYLYLGRLLSLPLEEDAQARLRGLDGESLQYLTFRAIETVLTCAAARQPVAIVCEDLHWADPSSLALLQRLLSATERAPLLYVCVFRPLREHGCWQIRELAARDYPHSHTDLWLQPLSGDESAALVGNLLHVEALPGALRARILARAEGNPFYVEEILRSLIEGGMVVQDEASGQWQATRAVGEIPISDTLHGVLAARIDRLPQETRRVLQQAAVLGRIFSYPVLAAVAGNGPLPRDRDGVSTSRPQEGGESLDAQLVALRRAQLIRERARLPEREYAFKHVLTQEAAYNGLLRRERRALHRRAAEALERLYTERLEEQLGLLAHHWEQAGEAEQARGYLYRAGVQAAAHFAHEEALSYIQRALDLTPEDALEERYALLFAREKVLDLQGARKEQRQDLAALESLAETLGDPGKQADVALRQVHLASRTQDYGTAAESARDAIHWAQAAQDRVRQAAARRELGRVLRYQEDYDAAQEELEGALFLARAAGARQVEVDVLHELGAVLATTGPRDELLLPWVEQLRTCREMGFRREEGRALRDIGLSCIQCGQYTDALGYLQESLQVCQETGNRRDEGWALHSLALLCRELGDYTTARAYGEQAMRVHDETGDRLGKVWAHLALAWADVHNGDYAAARERMGPVRELYAGGAALGLGDFALAQGDYSQARVQYEEALRLSSAEPGFTYHALCGLAQAVLAQGDLAQAQGYAAEVLRGLSVSWWSGYFLGLTPYQACYRVLRASEDPRAQEILDEAHRLLQTRADAIDDPALRRSYLENVPANREIVAAWQARDASSS